MTWVKMLYIRKPFYLCSYVHGSIISLCRKLLRLLSFTFFFFFASFIEIETWHI